MTWRDRVPLNLVGRLLGAMTLLFSIAAPRVSAEAPKAAVKAFDLYVARVENRLSQQHGSAAGFLAKSGSGSQFDARLRRGELIVERLAPPAENKTPGALLHHWRGTAFVAGATTGDFGRLMKNFDGYSLRFSPQVVRAKILSPYSGSIPDRFTAVMRVRQEHVIPVVMDTAYDVTFARLDACHGYSISRSTKIDEISSPGTAKERALTDAEEHGFLWRLNTYWSYEERDGGLYMQVESISLTRAIPTGLGWAIRPYVESVPRDSLEFTLRATTEALKQIRQNQER